MEVTKYEIDMLSVGAADAYLIRFFDEKEEQHVILVDAGYYANGKQIAEFVKKRYGTYTIDLAICTHCDDDHFGGFIYLCEQMLNSPSTSVDIKEILINDPGLHCSASDFKWYTSDANAQRNARKVYNSNGSNLLELLWKLRDSGKLSLYETFSDKNNSRFGGIIDIIGPSIKYYESLVPSFRNGMAPNYDYDVDNDSADAAIRDTKIFSQTLEDAGDDPSPHNQSSIMFLFKPSDGKMFLFTGDAGIAAFENIRYAEDVEKIQNVYWLKVPHHGSKKNLNNKWLNHIHPQVAYISTEKYTHYMSKAVVNALNKCNCNVYATNDGSNYWHHSKTPQRQDYHTATALN